ncbi:ferredoxin family protein [Sinorhizobium sp. 8-89]|uniref:indolepyruvate ferredoxin oxidoreductase subunit alpha n=1 Tax=Sinorhizobium sp. 7-81 TaxID=3049087 RepID=UPI0024C4050F|nr:ferredoxin family protein [Sinorhizobium sp. 7-81]MDK1386500.1 ferredoxin family protein [Sinorhizobium sp. 7-81]
MPHVVTENCDACRFTDCVTVCPVSCFHGDDTRIYIDPDACVDCGACVPACPVSAISEAGELTEDQQIWVSINAERAEVTPLIVGKQLPLATAVERRVQLGF